MLTCRELTEVITEYLEGNMSLGQRWGFRLHVSMCPACRRYLNQMRLTRDALGYLPIELVSDEMHEQLLQCFREWRGH